MFFEPLTLNYSGQKPLILEFVETIPRGSLLLFGFGLIALFVRPAVKVLWFAAPIAISNGLLTLAHLQGDLGVAGGIIAVIMVISAMAGTVAAVVVSRANWPTGLLFATACLPMIANQGLLSLVVLSGAGI